MTAMLPRSNGLPGLLIERGEGDPGRARIDAVDPSAPARVEHALVHLPRRQLDPVPLVGDGLSIHADELDLHPGLLRPLGKDAPLGERRLSGAGDRVVVEIGEPDVALAGIEIADVSAPLRVE